jgi:hypothetical protein
MSTEKQINANRQNAQKSTGPKSDQGKATVSQNAVKHGIFSQSVIKGENEADYEAFHDQMLAELAPAGVVDAVLAERAVNLAWRLRRAERMQNQAIDEMIEHQIDNPLSKRIRMINLHAKGIKLGDPRYTIGHLQLGRIVTHDWSNCRVLDRMLMYERRIENSLHKTLRELERHQLIRQYQQQEAEQEQDQFQLAPNTAGGSITDLKKQNQSRPSAGNPNSEYLNPKRVNEDTDMKKQSQLSVANISARSYTKGDYDKIPLRRAQENKAIQACPEPVERSQRISYCGERRALGERGNSYK